MNVERIELQQQAIATLRRDKSPREQWQQLCRWFDALAPSEQRAAISWLDALIDLPAEVRVVPANWVTHKIQGESVPGLALARALVHERPHLDSARFISLLEAPEWKEIKRIKLFGHGLDDRAVLWLAQQQRFRSLFDLNLTSNAITSQGLRAIIRGPSLQGVQRIFLGRNKICDEGAQWLIEQTAALRLELIDLRENLLSEKAGQALRTHFSRHNVEVRLHADAPRERSTHRRGSGRSRIASRNRNLQPDEPS